MATDRREIEVTVAEVALTATGAQLAATRHVLTAALLWPRVGTGRKAAVRTLSLDKGVARLDGRPWAQRILMKEAVEGRFGFELELTAALSDADTEAFMRALAGHLFKGFADDLADAAATGLGGLLASFPLAYLAKAVVKEKAPAVLAAGSLDLEAAALPAAGGRARWSVPLKTPAGVYRVTRRHAGRKGRTVRRELVPPGGELGHAVVEVAVL